jgi:hypothetical protein
MQRVSRNNSFLSSETRFQGDAMIRLIDCAGLSDEAEARAAKLAEFPGFTPMVPRH